MAQRRFNLQAAFATFLIVLNSIYASQLVELGLPFAKGGEPGPAFLPLALCLFIYVAGLRILFEALVCPETEATAEPTPGTVPGLARFGPVVVLVLTALYLVAFPWTGYFISTFCYTLLIALFFNFESSGDLRNAGWKSAVSALAITGFGWLFFVQLFGLFLPVWGG